MSTPVGTIITVIVLIMIGLGIWAFIDCLRRRADAFPAIDRQTKQTWLLLTGASPIVQFLFGYFGLLGLLGIAGAVVALVYLVDVRPKIIAITSGR